MFSFLGYANEVVICLFVLFEGFPISKIQTPAPFVDVVGSYPRQTGDVAVPPPTGLG